MPAFWLDMSQIATNHFLSSRWVPSIIVPAVTLNWREHLRALPLVGMPVHLGAGAVSACGADEASGMLLLEEPPLARLLVRISLQELQERAPALAFLPAQSACMALRHCFLRSSGCISRSSI
jgi:hypothetical protein